MSSRFRDFVCVARLLAIICSLPSPGIVSAEPATTASVVTDTKTSYTQRVLRVAADPNNLPFSNERQEGFENRIAELLAKEMGAKVEYVWHAQRRGFFRNTLKANKADIALGVPSGFEMARATRPFYHSSYVFVTRKDRGITISSLDDPQLRHLTIGLQLVGDDGNNTPPAHALGRRRITDNLKGYTVYGDYSQANPPARIVEAVAKGEIDVGIVWGPLAGYFATRQSVPLTIVPVKPLLDGPMLPMAYSICAGVRRGDDKLFADVERALDAAAPAIDKILREYQVPMVSAGDVPKVIEEDDDAD